MKDRKFYRDYTSKLIEKGVVGSALSFLTGVWVLASKTPIGWMLERVLEYAWDHSGDKFVRWAMRKQALIYDKVSGEIKLKKIQKAKDEDNDEDYWEYISKI